MDVLVTHSVVVVVLVVKGVVVEVLVVYVVSATRTVVVVEVTLGWIIAMQEHAVSRAACFQFFKGGTTWFGLGTAFRFSSPPF